MQYIWIEKTFSEIKKTATAVTQWILLAATGDRIDTLLYTERLIIYYYRKIFA